MALTEAELAELVAQLGPTLLEVAKVSVAESVAAVPTTSYRPGVVRGVSVADRTASVLLDGDTTATTVQILDQHPWPNARVMVRFVPPSAVFLDGIISASPIPPGVMFDYAGPITVHADAANATPTSNPPPPGFLWCAGQAVSRATYAALFAAIGTTHGAGDGATTFNVPDRRGRLALPLDNMGGTDAGRLSMANTLGATGGSNTLSTAQLPSHDHGLNSHTHSFSGSTGTESANHTHSSPDGASFVTASGGAVIPATGIYNANNSAGANTGTQSANHTHTFSGTTGGAAGNTAATGSGAEALPPYLLCNVIIKI